MDHINENKNMHHYWQKNVEDPFTQVPAYPENMLENKNTAANAGSLHPVTPACLNRTSSTT